MWRDRALRGRDKDGAVLEGFQPMESRWETGNRGSHGDMVEALISDWSGLGRATIKAQVQARYWTERVWAQRDWSLALGLLLIPSFQKLCKADPAKESVLTSIPYPVLQAQTHVLAFLRPLSPPSPCPPSLSRAGAAASRTRISGVQPDSVTGFLSG